MALSEETDKGRRDIRTDSYSMSIGELANLYTEKELEMHPEFQRFFRWSMSQKSRWIESLLLGIPTPSIFVAQRQDGVWDVVDGLQRLSTIFEFMGILLGDDGRRRPALVLEGTKLLPSLDAKKWEDPYDDRNSFTDEQRRMLKREKLDIKIILRESEEGTQYELFQRLNTGGSSLSDQELRNCVMISIDKTFFDWISNLAEESSFRECVPVSERLELEQFYLELALRFVVFRKLHLHEIGNIRNLADFLNERCIELAKKKDFPREEEAEAFIATFRALEAALGEDSFRKFDRNRDRFTGPMLVSAFEVIALGLGFEHPSPWIASPPNELIKIIKNKVWTGTSIVTKPGESAATRIPRTIDLGRTIFKNESS